MSILKALYSGSILPDKMSTSSYNKSEYQQISQKLADLTEKLEKKLGEDDRKLFLTILDLMVSSERSEVFSTFEYGFRLGAAIMVEVLVNKEDLIDPQGLLRRSTLAMAEETEGTNF
jgi:hypothetical protein